MPVLSRAYDDSSITDFPEADSHRALGPMVARQGHSLEAPQDPQELAWRTQIERHGTALRSWPEGYLPLEHALPRTDKRADVTLQR